MSVVNELAILVSVDFRASSHNCNSELDEFVDLATTANLKSVATILCCRNTPDPNFFIGSGKTKELCQLVAEKHASVIIFNHNLSPRQEHNLSSLCGCVVIDRVSLILDIFAQRARSFEGKLQVELAQLRHLSSRLIRGWTHLERQKGGIGLRGPGETQLETDRRLIGKRIKLINARLKKVRSQHQQNRKRRAMSNALVVSLVGYTNAGKSTLFNQLIGSNIYATNKLFATLDPTFRRLKITSAVPVILTDTVGFIRHIPHDLVEAFYATLEEIREADLLLHVIDIKTEQLDDRIEQVNQVVSEIGAESVPQIEVYNKIDQHDDVDAKIIMGNVHIPDKVWLSGKTGEGIDGLLTVIKDFIGRRTQRHRLILPASAARLRTYLFDLGVVHKEQSDNNGGWVIDIDIELYRLKQIYNDNAIMSGSNLI